MNAQSSKDFFQTPNRLRMLSPNQTQQSHPQPDILGLMNQKLAYISNCIKNFVLSASKIQKLLSQRADDPETVFALKLFEEDKRQIERFLKKIEAVKYLYKYYLFFGSKQNLKIFILDKNWNI